MTAFLFIVALIGWLLAILGIVGVSILSIYISAQQAEEFQKIIAKDKQISKNEPSRTTLWSYDPKKEIPFGD